MECDQVEEMEGEELSKMQGNSEYMVHYPTSSSEDVGEVIPTPPLISEEVQRFSLRNLQNMEGRMQEKAIAISKKRNLECTSANHNSFDALSNPELMIRASKMGIAIPDNNFSNVDIIRELEIIRGENYRKEGEQNVMIDEEVMYITNGKGDQTPVSADWGDGDEDVEEHFTLVWSRKKRSPKVQVAISRPTTRSQKPVGGKQTGSPVHNTRATRGGRKGKRYR
jgi:hypothetical protein